MIVAIDGPAGSGKTTTARKVAQILGFIHINTGAMYRGIALKFIREKVNLDDTSAIERILNNTQLDFGGPNNAILYMDGEDISAEIISSTTFSAASKLVRVIITTDAPASASDSDMARPIFLAPPVTTAVLPSNKFMA